MTPSEKRSIDKLLRSVALPGGAVPQVVYRDGERVPMPGNVMVFRTPGARNGRSAPRVGKLVGPTGGETIAVKPARGRNRRYSTHATLVPRSAIVRFATEREAVLGFPVDPVPAVTA